MCMDAHALYACDYIWWVNSVDMWSRFKGMMFSLSEGTKEFGVCHVPSQANPGLGKDRIHTGGNSGYQAVNLAYLFGCKRIVLLGFDMQMTNGKTHWHGDHKKSANPDKGLLNTWAKNFNQLAIDLKNEGVELLNASRETALTCCPRITIDELVSKK